VALFGHNLLTSGQNTVWNTVQHGHTPLQLLFSEATLRLLQNREFLRAGVR
jgi:hypothetical protein